jgi:hypothetical protein
MTWRATVRARVRPCKAWCACSPSAGARGGVPRRQLLLMPMQEQPHTPVQSSEPATTRPIRHLELKAALLLVFTALLIGGSVLACCTHAACSRRADAGVVADDSEGVVVGTRHDLLGLSDRPCEACRLAETGTVHIIIDVAKRTPTGCAPRASFTLVRGLVGGTNIRAFSGIHRPAAAGRRSAAGAARRCNAGFRVCCSRPRRCWKTSVP